jgi:hypothetical protein
METDADRLDTIQAVGGVLVRATSVQFWAIFDREFEAVGSGGLEIESRTPALTCRTSDVASLQKDEPFQIGSETYRLKRPEPDLPAPGWTVLLLKL